MQPEASKRVLIVDDDDTCVALAQHFLRLEGYETETANSCREALERIERVTFDVVLSDLWMDRRNSGLELLERLREQTDVVSVVLMTARPGVDSAAAAVDLEASAYLRKPFDRAQLSETMKRALHRTRRMRAIESAEVDYERERTLSESDHRTLTGALDQLYLAYQPIFAASSSRRGQEALMRSRSPELANPGAILASAERLGRLGDVTDAVLRRLVDDLPRLEGDVFVNLHADDLFRGVLLDDTLRAHANRIVLEVTETGPLPRGVVQPRLAELRAAGYRIAVDDLGAGYSALSRLAEMMPDVVKLDMSLIRNIDQCERRRRLVAAIVELCADEGAEIVAEGIETDGERRTVVDIGCGLLQGYLLGRPTPLATAPLAPSLPLHPHA